MTDSDAVDLVIQRQGVDAANLVWQLLNPDQKQQALHNEKVEILINEERSWESFANDKVYGENIKGNYFETVSLESFHDMIHVLLGTGGGHIAPNRSGFKGHMGNPRYAAVSISGPHPNGTDIPTV